MYKDKKFTIQKPEYSEFAKSEYNKPVVEFAMKIEEDIKSGLIKSVSIASPLILQTLSLQNVKVEFFKDLDFLTITYYDLPIVRLTANKIYAFEYVEAPKDDRIKELYGMLHNKSGFIIFNK